MDEIVFEQDKNPKYVITELLELACCGNFVFRGYNREQEMLPSILRNSGDITKEWDMLKKFEIYGSTYFKAYSIIDFMSYAQHYGLPTRLLDFTENPLIALMFALYEKKGTKDNYYSIAYANLDESIVFESVPVMQNAAAMDMGTELLIDRAKAAILDIEGAMNGDDIEKQEEWIQRIIEVRATVDNKELLRSKVKKKTLVFIKPNQANQRIFIQQGLFMLPYTLDRQTLKNQNKSNCGTIRIHKNLRDGCKKYLRACGISPHRMMPDLVSICNSIKRNDL